MTYKRRAAVFTVSRDEPVFLPIWLNYQLKNYDAEDIYVLDHDSSPTPTLPAGVVRIPIHHSCYGDHNWQGTMTQRFQHFLLDSYDCVLYSDVDEIVFPCPLKYPGGLRQYINEMARPVVRCQGFELVHNPATATGPKEPALDTRELILKQRWYMRQSGVYSKTLLSKMMLHWAPGLHGTTNVVAPIDPFLILMHLRRMDYEMCWQRTLAAATAVWGPRDGGGHQNQITDPAVFNNWFYKDFYDGQDIPCQVVPEHWRSAV